MTSILDVTPALWAFTAAVILGLIALDFLTATRKSHEVKFKEAAFWSVFYIAVAVAFGVFVWTRYGSVYGTEYFAAYLVEKSLSVDNLFVFVIIMSRFSVPRKYQQEVLMVGVIMALVLRGIFILAGAALIESFSAIFYLFGAFLIYTAYHQAFRSESDEEESESKLIVWLRKRIHVSDDFDGAKIRTVVNGKKAFTPMLVVFIAIAMTDVMFAFDSIPAIFGITTDAFIVFAANVFALMGLRQLYFLLGGLLDKLEYLKYGIAFILGFIGVKLVAHAMHVNELPFVNGGKAIEWAPEISTNTSLAVIVASIGVAAIASAVKIKVTAKSQQK